MKNTLRTLRNLPEVLSTLSFGSLEDANQRSKKQTEAVVKEYIPLIKFIAKRFVHKVPGALELDELISCGVIGLIDAMKKFDPRRMNKFKTYAEFRIRGAILDELRNLDWTPRSIRDKSKQIKKTEEELTKKFGRKATDEEISNEMGISTEKYLKLLNKVQHITLVSFEDIFNNGTHLGNEKFLGLVDNLNLDNSSASDGSNSSNSGNSACWSINPFDIVNFKMAQIIIQAAIEKLPNIQKTIIRLYYFEGLRIKDISKQLHITSARVSQLHSQAVLRLKELFKGEFQSADDLNDGNDNNNNTDMAA